MAKDIIAQVAGGSKQVLDDVFTVRDVASRLGALEGYTALVNREPAELTNSLSDNDIVTFAKAVKGGRI